MAYLESTELADLHHFLFRLAIITTLRTCVTNHDNNELKIYESFKIYLLLITRKYFVEIIVIILMRKLLYPSSLLFVS